MEFTKELEILSNAAKDKLAEDITAIDMSQVSPFSDCFLLLTAKNQRHVEALAQAMEDTCAKENIPVRAREGVRGSDWIIIDTGSIMVHIFTQEARKAYRLEALWGDQPQHHFDAGN